MKNKVSEERGQAADWGGGAKREISFFTFYFEIFHPYKRNHLVTFRNTRIKTSSLRTRTVPIF